MESPRDDLHGAPLIAPPPLAQHGAALQRWRLLARNGARGHRGAVYFFCVFHGFSMGFSMGFCGFIVLFVVLL